MLCLNKILLVVIFFTFCVSSIQAGISQEIIEQIDRFIYFNTPPSYLVQEDYKEIDQNYMLSSPMLFGFRLEGVVLEDKEELNKQLIIHVLRALVKIFEETVNLSKEMVISCLYKIINLGVEKEHEALLLSLVITLITTEGLIPKKTIILPLTGLIDQLDEEL